MNTAFHQVFGLDNRRTYPIEFYGQKPKSMRILIFIIAIPITIVLITALTTLTSNVVTSFDLYGLMAMIIYCAVQFHKEGESESNTEILILFLVALAIRTAFCFLYNMEPYSDFLATYKRALRMSQEPISQWHDILNTTYTTTFSNITPYIIYETMIIKLFGDSYIPLQIINIVASAGTCVFVAKIAGAIWGKSKNRRAISLCGGYTMAVNPMALFYMSVLTCQHVATFLCFGALYFLICKPLKNTWANLGLCGILLAFSQLMRPEMSITIIAIVCYLIYLLIEFSANRSYKIQPVIRAVVGGALVFVLFWGINFGTDYVLRSSGIVSTPITKSNLLYKVLVGMNYDSSGKVNSSDMALIGNDQEMLAELKERLSSPVKVIKLIGMKINQNYATYGSSAYYFKDLPDDNIYMFVRYYVYLGVNNAFMLAMLISVLFSVLGWIKEMTKPSLFIFILMSGFVLVFLVIEIQARYLQIIFPLYAIFAAKTNSDTACKLKLKLRKTYLT